MLAFALLLSLVFMPVKAEARFCAEEKAGAQSLGYCLEGSRGSDTLLVFLPGVLSSEKRLSRRYFFLEHLKKSGRPLPHVLSLGFGRVTFLADQEGQPVSKLAELVRDLVGRVRRQSGASRALLLGDSMGGFNALQILLREPGAFHRAALICPALAISSPFSEQWSEDPDTQRASRFYRYAYGQALRWSFGTEENWLRSSPLAFLARARFRAPLPPLYLASIQTDTYGFVDAVAVAARGLRLAGFPVQESVEPQGGHCFPDTEKLARFLFD
jgi:pimeloyl-ACP methyl ester carboxylesterase